MVKAFTPSKTGLYKYPFRLRVGKKIPNRPGNKNVYLIQEFENEISVGNVTKMVTNGRFSLSRKAYIAGTNTYIQIYRSKRK